MMNLYESTIICWSRIFVMEFAKFSNAGCHGLANEPKTKEHTTFGYNTKKFTDIWHTAVFE